ncbi:MAG: hypothetical protein KDN22_08855 [Verrucomicrobiae bacterium]|nr:hypothetical protein [Verrucomicrobiae bacterium]
MNALFPGKAGSILLASCSLLVLPSAGCRLVIAMVFMIGGVVDTDAGSGALNYQLVALADDFGGVGASGERVGVGSPVLLVASTEDLAFGDAWAAGTPLREGAVFGGDDQVLAVLEMADLGNGLLGVSGFLQVEYDDKLDVGDPLQFCWFSGTAALETVAGRAVGTVGYRQAQTAQPAAIQLDAVDAVNGVAFTLPPASGTQTILAIPQHLGGTFDRADFYARGQLGTITNKGNEESYQPTGGATGKPRADVLLVPFAVRSVGGSNGGKNTIEFAIRFRTTVAEATDDTVARIEYSSTLRPDSWRPLPATAVRRSDSLSTLSDDVGSQEGEWGILLIQWEVLPQSVFLRLRSEPHEAKLGTIE